MHSDDTYRPAGGQAAPLRLVGPCTGCGTSAPTSAAFPVPTPHHPPGLTAWVCVPCAAAGLKSAGTNSRMEIEVDPAVGAILITGRPSADAGGAR